MEIPWMFPLLSMNRFRRLQFRLEFPDQLIQLLWRGHFYMEKCHGKCHESMGSWFMDVYGQLFGHGFSLLEYARLSQEDALRFFSPSHKKSLWESAKNALNIHQSSMSFPAGGSRLEVAERMAKSNGWGGWGGWGGWSG